MEDRDGALGTGGSKIYLRKDSGGCEGRLLFGQGGSLGEPMPTNLRGARSSWSAFLTIHSGQALRCRGGRSDAARSDNGPLTCASKVRRRFGSSRSGAFHRDDALGQRRRSGVRVRLNAEPPHAALPRRFQARWRARRATSLRPQTPHYCEETIGLRSHQNSWQVRADRPLQSRPREVIGEQRLHP